MAERSRGFTLLETLVALVIVAVVIGGALRALGAGIRGTERAEGDLAMARLAERVLDQARLDLRLGRGGESSGSSGGLEWELAQQDLGAVSGAAAGQMRLVLLRAIVTAPGGDRLEFSTAALVEAEP